LPIMENTSTVAPNAPEMAMILHPFVASDANACSRRLNIDPPCRLNIDPGRVATF
jgi:hypothetical protein